jgi:Protein kinase domain
MKCISLWQSWATLVVAGLKKIDTRSWGNDHRGLLGIHAARKDSDDLRRLCHIEPGFGALSAHRELLQTVSYGRPRAGPNARASLTNIRPVPLKLLSTTEAVVVACLPDAARDSRLLAGWWPMPTPNADDPLQTTDHTSLPETCPDAFPADQGRAPSPAGQGTVTFQPTKGEPTDGAGATPSEPPPSVPGYEIDGVLGRGGMGVVYKVRPLALKRPVALKMILADSHAGPGELARFRIEAEAVARLSHPNIVQIHEVGEAGGHPYCALEFIEGGNLARKSPAHH